MKKYVRASYQIGDVIEGEYYDACVGYYYGGESYPTPDKYAVLYKSHNSGDLWQSVNDYGYERMYKSKDSALRAAKKIAETWG